MVNMHLTGKLAIVIWLLLNLVGCDNQSWNDPYPKSQRLANIRYASFSEPPKTLDPAVAYTAEAMVFIAQTYEPPLQYHYLLRPYTLVPLASQTMPKITYWDKQGHPLPTTATSDQIAYTSYDISIKPGIFYQPHPAFAKNKQGEYLYHHLTEKDLHGIKQLSDFTNTSTRELVADDYVYEIKRLASPQVSSPVFGLMSQHILGLKDYAKTLQTAYSQRSKNAGFFDLRQFPLAGVQIVDRYTYRITIEGRYDQFIYWLAMPFFAPVPWEADLFYSQPGMKQRNLTLGWYPIGTGPYMLKENNPNRRMVLVRNPNFHTELYPSEGTQEDLAKGLLSDAGKPLPLIDAVVFALEKETIPRWNKFLQGYYDLSTISSDAYDQAIRVDSSGHPYLTPALKKQGIQLETSVDPAIFYLGFNMLDETVGGYSQRAIKLRQAIAIAVRFDEYIKIFLNGRGIPAQGPIPPGIFGYVTGAAGMDNYIYRWQDDQIQPRPLADAKRLLAEAGYPNGRDVRTGKPLILNYDAITSTGPDDKARFDWMRTQFARIGIQLNIRATQYNRFQQKMDQGSAQIYFWGWSADYPDPENFLFLLYGPEGKVKYGGENASNYSNPNYDRLFEAMRNMPNGPERQAIINQMLAIVRYDTPWVWGIHTEDFILRHQWNGPTKAMAFGNNALKYQRLNPILRAEKRAEWNRPHWGPLLILGLFFAVILVPVIINYWRKLHRPRVKKYQD